MENGEKERTSELWLKVGLFSAVLVFGAVFVLIAMLVLETPPDAKDPIWLPLADGWFSVAKYAIGAAFGYGVVRNAKKALDKRADAGGAK